MDVPTRIWVDSDGRVIQQHEAVNGARQLCGKAADAYLKAQAPAVDKAVPAPRNKGK